MHIEHVKDKVAAKASQKSKQIADELTMLIVSPHVSCVPGSGGEYIKGAFKEDVLI